MYSLLRSLTCEKFLSQTAPPLMASLLIAELLYKFHSFALECIAFLVTWCALDWVWTSLPRSRS